MSLSHDIIAAYRDHPTIYTAAKRVPMKYARCDLLVCPLARLPSVCTAPLAQ